MVLMYSGTGFVVPAYIRNTQQHRTGPIRIEKPGAVPRSGRGLRASGWGRAAKLPLQQASLGTVSFVSLSRISDIDHCSPLFAALLQDVCAAFGAKRPLDTNCYPSLIASRRPVRTGTRVAKTKRPRSRRTPAR